MHQPHASHSSEKRVQHALSRCLQGLHDLQRTFRATLGTNRFCLDELVSRDEANPPVLLRCILDRVNEVEKNCDYEQFAPLAILFHTAVFQASHLPESVHLLHQSRPVLRRILSWPVPHCSMAQDLLSIVDTELRAPGISYQRLIRSEHNLKTKSFPAKTKTIFLLDPAEIPAEFIATVEQAVRSPVPTDYRMALIRRALQATAAVHAEGVEEALRTMGEKELQRLFEQSVDMMEEAARRESQEQARAFLLDATAALQQQIIDLARTSGDDPACAAYVGVGSERGGMEVTCEGDCTAACLAHVWDKDNLNFLYQMLPAEHVPSVDSMPGGEGSLTAAPSPRDSLLSDTSSYAEDDNFANLLSCSSDSGYLEDDPAAALQAAIEADIGSGARQACHGVPWQSSAQDPAGGRENLRADFAMTTATTTRAEEQPPSYEELLPLALNGSRDVRLRKSCTLPSKLANSRERTGSLPIISGPFLGESKPAQRTLSHKISHRLGLLRDRLCRAAVASGQPGKAEQPDVGSMAKLQRREVAAQWRRRVAFGAQGTRRRHCNIMRLVAFGEDHILGKLARAYNRLWMQELWNPQLFRHYRLEIFYIPLAQRLSSSETNCNSNSPRNSFQTTDNDLLKSDVLMNIGNYLGSVDPWYDRNVLSLYDMLPTLLPKTSSKDEVSNSQKEVSMLMDMILYYCQHAAHPHPIPLYEIEITLASGDVKKEVFICQLELGFLADRRAILAAGSAQKRFGIEGDREAVPIHLQIAYCKTSLSKRIHWHTMEKTCTSVRIIQNADRDAGMGTLNLTLLEVVRRSQGSKGKSAYNQQLNALEVRVDKVQLTAAGGSNFSLCIDRDDKKVFRNITRCEVRPCCQVNAPAHGALAGVSHLARPTQPPNCEPFCLPISLFCSPAL
ncbi:phosphoinositide 3-kinase regulatory subunit 5-like [Lampetra fluviatilis]